MRAECIQRIVATNDDKGYTTMLYCNVFYALGELWNYDYDSLYQADNTLINPITHGYKLSKVDSPGIPLLIHILHDYPIEVLNSVATILEHYEDEMCLFEDCSWDTGYDSN